MGRFDKETCSYRSAALTFRAVGGVAIAGGIGSLINHSFSSIIIGIYEVIAGALIIFLEVRPPTEEHKALIQQYASFMHSFIGRGVCE